MYRIFLNFAKSCVLSCLSIVDNIKKFHRGVFELYAPKAAIKGVFSVVAMVTYCGTKMVTTCSPMVG